MKLVQRDNQKRCGHWNFRKERFLYIRDYTLGQKDPVTKFSTIYLLLYHFSLIKFNCYQIFWKRLENSYFFFRRVQKLTLFRELLKKKKKKMSTPSIRRKMAAKIEPRIWYCRRTCPFVSLFFVSLHFCFFFFCTVQKYIYKDYFSWQYSCCIASNMEIRAVVMANICSFFYFCSFPLK